MVKLKKFYDVEATDNGSSAPGPQVSNEGLSAAEPVQIAENAQADVSNEAATTEVASETAPVEQAPLEEAPAETEESFIEKVEDKLEAIGEEIKEKVEEVVEEVKEFFNGETKAEETPTADPGDMNTIV